MKKDTVVTISIVAAILLLFIAVYFYVKKQKTETELALAAKAVEPVETNKNDVYVAGISAGGNLLSSIVGLFKPRVG